ncbi:hypothetical protein ZIOFF_045555 [Zingiber officinale]|uniref:Subtilisin-like protease fibronectin type-III domain-containing protein n=1 Tax=Zingiber officinale TaxID=94328 RepID=A0A8J5L1A1_ZINOF|nr:hypothetical protein ZIOFF_045555 [Zingiber officinale]
MQHLAANHPNDKNGCSNAMVIGRELVVIDGCDMLENRRIDDLADPFDFGGGHINPNRSLDPGLIYDVDPNDDFKFFNCTNDASNCDLEDAHLYHLNLPSVSISDLKSSATIKRTVTNVHTFALTFTSLHAVQGDFNFGSLTWSDGGKHLVRIPLAVRVSIQDYFSDTS